MKVARRFQLAAEIDRLPHYGTRALSDSALANWLEEHSDELVGFLRDPTPSSPGDLTFAQLRVVSLERCARWHDGGVMGWGVADWAVAMAGEAGEICNAVKKLRRVEDQVANINDLGRQLTTRAEALAAIGDEIADTQIYLDLLAARVNVDLAAAVVSKFNRVSIKYGFPERLPEVTAVA